MNIRPQFDSRQKFKVARAFKFAGRTFVVGKEFPWRSIGCSVRRLKQIYDNRKIDLVAAQTEVTEAQLKEMEPSLPAVDAVVKPVEKVVAPEVIDKPAADEVEASTEVAPEVKPELSDEEKKAKKAARRKAARKAAKEAAGE